MTPEQEATIRARHERCVGARFDTTNEYDHVCDPAVLLAALDDARADIASAIARGNRAARQRDAACADADRLTGALRRAETFLTALSPDENHLVSETRDAVRAALAAREAQR